MLFSFSLIIIALGLGTLIKISPQAYVVFFSNFIWH